jgi:threonine dehydratase
VTASSGNHGQAVALAAREAGVHATVFMPEDAPMAKVEAARNYGAEIVLVGQGYDESHQAALERVQAGATLVHAFEDPMVIAGQGTLGLELTEQLPEDVEVVVVPVGGGGLASGIALALKERRPSVRIVGVQAANCAPYTGVEPAGSTIADGIAVKTPGELTRSILADRIDSWVTVEDDQIAAAIVLLLERVKLVVEGAGAVSAGTSTPACSSRWRGTGSRARDAFSSSARGSRTGPAHSPSSSRSLRSSTSTCTPSSTTGRGWTCP